MYKLFREYTYISPLIVALSLLFVTSSLYGQGRARTYETYIDRYGLLAQEHMDRYRIPASIKLAQGILESGAGMSDLARNSNNHFGIKCHRGWSGPRVFAPDDTPNDCFRKYSRVEDSYRDHSDFLVNGARYRPLIELSITDYKGTARGLQKLGYATDRTYANLLFKSREY